MNGRRRARESRVDARERRAGIIELGPVMDAAARFLEVRLRSVEETRRRLIRAGYPAELVTRVVDRLVELGYLDDEAFARAWVESRDRAHPRGTAALRRELAAKGVASEIIGRALEERELLGSAGHARDAERGRRGSTRPQALVAGRRAGRAPAEGSTTDDLDVSDGASLDADDRAAARVLERRSGALLREADQRKRAARAYALLARAGFDPDTCRSTVRAWLAGLEAYSPEDDE